MWNSERCLIDIVSSQRTLNFSYLRLCKISSDIILSVHSDALSKKIRSITAISNLVVLLKYLNEFSQHMLWLLIDILIDDTSHTE